MSLAAPARAAGVHPFKLASLLLQYPTTAFFDGLDHLDVVAAATPRGCREPFGRFLAWLRRTSPTEVAQHYVDTFDLRRRCALYLTYHRHGDTRRRGMAMLAFKAAYHAAGLTPTDDELPDYLPLVLEFAAHAPRGQALLRAHRVDLELLRRALHAAATPYAEVLDAVAARLPGPGRRELALIGQLWGRRPPDERVGIEAAPEPFAPPEYLTGTPRPTAGGRPRSRAGSARGQDAAP